MEAPEQIHPTSLRDYFQVLSRAVFQSGMSWRVIDAKWSGMLEAFHEFDPETVARLSPDDIDALAANPRIVRNRRKIEATVANANTMLDIAREHGGFKQYLDSIDGFELRSADLKKRFRFLGDFGAYYFLYVVGEPVPGHEEFRQRHMRR
ncbi:MAG: hypothetical protein Kow0010_16480 [Dehalococcoidia bacterium]